MATIELIPAGGEVTRPRDREWWVRFVAGALVFTVVVVGMTTQIAGRIGNPGAGVAVQKPDFWTQIHVNGAYQSYSSLDAMAGDASVIVLGQFISVTKGRVFRPEPEYGDRGVAFYLDATFVVSDVLRGSLADKSSTTIHIELFAGRKSELPDATLQQDKQILFLINKAQAPSNAKMSADDLATEARYYEILGGQEQGRLTVSNSKVQVSSAISPDEFPSELSGEPVATVVDLINALK